MDYGKKWIAVYGSSNSIQSCLHVFEDIHFMFPLLHHLSLNNDANVWKRTLSDDTRWEIKSFFKKKMEKKTYT